MSPVATSRVAPSTPVDYLRTARRLRATLGHDPARLQVALRNLSRQCDAQASRRVPQDRRDGFVRQLILDDAPPSADTRHAPPGSGAIFSSRVEAALAGGVLRFSDRQDLLREAKRMGIPRFEATLLIAAVQHRAADRSTAATYTLGVPSRMPKLAVASFVAALQTGIVYAVWWLLHG